VKVRIGIAESQRVVELEVDDAAAFEASVEESYAGDTSLLWFEDTKHRRVGIPRDRISYIEIETLSEKSAVGFAAGS
jgi:hypothetical protein